MSERTNKLSIKEYLIKSGFILDSKDDIYKMSAIYNYGHLGVLLKENIKNEWKKFFINSRKNAFWMDGSILTPTSLWTTSGHLNYFHDFLVDCRKCKNRFRVDHLKKNENGNFICLKCGSTDFTKEKEFNLIFKTSSDYYLRPETAQLIFSNFNNILRTFNPKLPFSVAQIGKSFRNEITTSNFIFRTKEFEQMECEWFIKENNWESCFKECLKDMNTFLVDILGIKKELIREIEIKKEDLAHYSKKNKDIEFLFEHGWSELWGLAYRGDWDLSSYEKYTGKDFKFYDVIENKKYTPHVVEHSIGLDRLLYALITNAFTLEKDGNNSREILKIKYELSPYKFSIFPLTKEQINISEKIWELFLSNQISVFFSKQDSIGKRYRKSDFLGIPYCITVDYESLNNDLNNPSFTIRDRDTKEQKRFFLLDLIDNEFKLSWIQKKFSNSSSN